MSKLRDILETNVGTGPVPGAVGLVACDGRVEVQAAGAAGAPGSAPMARDSIFRIASITKPITAAAPGPQRTSPHPPAR
jgi:CubicO group peptidase (beta-lactamase class C family)